VSGQRCVFVLVCRVCIFQPLSFAHVCRTGIFLFAIVLNVLMRMLSNCPKAKRVFLNARFAFVYKCRLLINYSFNRPDTHENQTVAVYYMRRFACGQSCVASWRHA